MARIGEMVRAGYEAIRPGIEQAQAAWTKFAPAINEFIVSMKKLPAEYREALMALANEGWYLDPDQMAFSEPAKLAREIREGRVQEVEDQLIAHFRARLDGIEAALVQQFPARTAVLKQGFEAHRLGLYYTSIPTFFAQVDGVCLDISKHHLFMQKKGAPKGGVAPYVDQIANNPLTVAMLAPFLEPHAVLFNPKQRAPGFSKLNRHLVVHGESLDYGTEANSLRAISLLYYAARALSEFGKPASASPTP